MIYSINGNQLKNMVESGAGRLVQCKEMLDALNVFPVPDGDTGTNMSFTVLAAATAAAAENSNSAAAVAKAAASGSLRGARGNSGVILSQLFRGFAKGLEGYAEADTNVLALALSCASETAYRAVMKPKEGTMLTIGRELGQKALELAQTTDDIIVFLKELLKHGEEVLKKTPDMLPALKQAGVVDSGGKGILEILYGALACAEAGFTVTAAAPQPATTQTPEFAGISHSAEDITFAYCTEFLVHTENDDAEDMELPLREYLDTLGDSVVVVGDGNVIKIHVHTNNPGLAIEKALTYGMLDALKIDNMKIQAAEAGTSANAAPAYTMPVIANEPEEPKPFGVVAVAAGEGFCKLFEDLGVDVVIEGGQTMNPGVEDICAAAARVNAGHVFVLPNNKNIILAAEQAQYLCGEKTMSVIPTKSVPQGISAMLNYDLAGEPDYNAEAMNAAIGTVKTGQITHAVRDTVVNDKQIAEGDYLFIRDGEIETAGKDLFEGAEQLLDAMIDGDSEFVTVYYGATVPEPDAQALCDTLSEKYAHCEFQLHNGGQPVYYYVFSVE